jgi:hypothetical protein
MYRLGGDLGNLMAENHDLGIDKESCSDINRMAVIQSRVLLISSPYNQQKIRAPV